MLTGQSERPVCTILGDPNGADKSSVFAALDFPGRFVNADVIAHRINTASPESVSVTAGKHVLRELDELIVGRESIAYETTLSSHQSIALVQRAIEARYQVNLVFVALRDANLHVKRVAQRVEEGGHDISEAIIRRRYESSMTRLVPAVRLAHEVMIFDNSELSGPFLLMQITAGVIEINNLEEAQAFHRRIATSVGDALGVDANKVFAAARPFPP